MKRLLPYAGIILGSLIFAFGLNSFIIANGLAEGGFTGLALIIHYLSGWPVGVILLVLNIPLVILGWRKLGASFAFKTLLAIIAVSLAIDLTQGCALKTNDLLLAALYGGVFSGVGIGIVLYSGATTGGVDIIARLIHDYKGISMGLVFFIFDLFVISLVAILFGLEKALYTLVALFIFSRIIDRILEGFEDAKAVTIISHQTQEITDLIIKELDRGATIINGKGAYTGLEKKMIYVVVSKYQLLRLKRIVRDQDPQAFIIINSVYEVLGEGFRSPSS